MNYKLGQCKHGWMLYNPNDMYVGRSLEHYGESCEWEMKIFAQLLPSDAVVVDGGANIGTHALWFARHADVVYSFEPQRLIYYMLCANLALNEIINVIAIHAALGEEARTISVPVLDWRKEQNFAGLQLKGCTDGEPVSMVTIDSLGLTRCDLIKLDVEGCEAEALEGARETIARCRPFLYVEDDKEEQRDAVRAKITELGYAFKMTQHTIFNEDNFRGNRENVFDGQGNFNLLCVPEEKAATQDEDAAA